MADFFTQLVSKDLFNKWAETLDWLVDDNKFNKDIWTSNQSGKLTGKIKQIKSINDYYYYDTQPKLPFPKRRGNRIKVIFSKGDTTSESKDLVRHIRNGIAHGHTYFSYVNDELYIEIKDYRTNKQKKIKEQTAYIFFPIKYITKICECYKEVKNPKKKNKSTTKMKGRKKK